MTSDDGADAVLVKKFHSEANYFAGNVAPMSYPKSRKQHLFAGSGILEAGCKTAFGRRLGHSGIFWPLKGTNAILASRRSRLDGRFECQWGFRCPTRAALLSRAPRDIRC